MRPALVPLGADDVEAAGGERLLLELGDLARGSPRSGRSRSAALLEVGEFVRDAHVGIAAELDVGAAARHVGGDRDRAGHAGLGDDEGLLLVEAGVQHGEGLGRLAVAGRPVERLQRVRVGEVDQRVALLDHEVGELLGLLDRGGADQDGWPFSAAASISRTIAFSFSAAVR